MELGMTSESERLIPEGHISLRTYSELEEVSLERHSFYGARSCFHCGCFRFVSSCTRAWCPAQLMPMPPIYEWSELELKTLRSIIVDYGVTFDFEDSEHLAMLNEVAASGGFDIQFCVKKLSDGTFSDHKSEKWQELGFQSQNPLTDLRGTGILGLRCVKELLSGRFRSLVSKMGKEELLCAATCINMAQALIFHLRLYPKSSRLHILDPSSSRVHRKDEEVDVVLVSITCEAMLGFYDLCTADGSTSALSVFTKVVAASMAIFLRKWESLKENARVPPTILDCPEILFETRLIMLHLLSGRPRSINTLEAWTLECSLKLDE